MSAAFDYIQTFSINRDRVNNSAEVMLTSIDLYFKAKPSLTTNASGSAKPSVSVWICDVTPDVGPIVQRVVKDSISRVEYELINTTGNASSSTRFSFRNPLVITAGKTYGLVIKFSDPAFDIWINKQGDRLVDESGPTGTPSPGAQSRFDGELYRSNNTNNFLKFDDRDLKLKINIAKFTGTTASVNLVNKNYEFLSFDAFTGTFRGGEWVYQVTANSTGTLSVSSTSRTLTGTGTTLTNFTEGQKIVIESATTIDVLTIERITNTTSMIVDRSPSFSNAAIGFSVPPMAKVNSVNYSTKKLYLVDSNAANATFKFAAGSVKGQISKATATITTIDRFAIDAFRPEFKIGNPSTSSYSVQYKLANTANNIAASFSNLENQKHNKVSEKSYILSRSDEVVGSSLFGTNNKSAVANLTFTVTASTTNLFTVPYVSGDDLDFYMQTYDVNNVYTETRNGIEDYDTEIDRNGLAKSKYISMKYQLEEKRYSEDLVVYVKAYRPFGTQVRVYAKLQNTGSDNEPFDDKAWTPLELKNNNDKYSREDDERNLIEYTYGLPQYPAIRYNIDTSFTVDPANNSIATSTNVSSNVSVNDLVRLYDPSIPQNHEVFKVISANSTAIELNKLVSNVNIPTNPSVDLLKYKTIGFNNIASDNVARYYTTSTNQEVDKFNMYQIKIVMLTDNSYLIPKVDSLMAIATSA